MKQLLITLFLATAMSLPGISQEVLFNRGVNLTNWFQASGPGAIQFGKYGKKDFENIQSLGCDVIRLPINLHFMTQGAPEHRLDPLFLTFLDSAVAWAEELGLHLILDNHSFDPSADTEPTVQDVLIKVWTQMAQHYNGKYENLYYEVLNEPHGIDDAVWGEIQRKAIAAIRSHDTEHTIIVGGAGWNSYHNLKFIPEYEDDNLIYTFHFYDPFLFTHQGATWNTPSMDELKNIPFPYDAGNMPPLHSKYNGTWIQNIYDNYEQEGTVARVKELIDIAVAFREDRKVPVFCGEFGVYDINSDPEDRVEWYKVVREYLEEKKIPWTMWDYHGGFGVFRKGEQGLFEHNLNTELLESLDFNVPAQTPFEVTPDTTGFHLYDDFLHPGIDESSYGAGTINYYATDQPNYGQHCIRWMGPEQYNIIGLDFTPDRDFTVLAAENFALDFFIRSTATELRLDVRFLDTDTGEDDHAWRKRFSIVVDGEKGSTKWNHFRIPLSEFAEQGAWENEWFNPEGKFQWSEVDRFEFSTEHGGYQSDTIWIDQIVISNLDTASVLSTSLFSPRDPVQLALYPNPCTSDITLDYQVGQDVSAPVSFRIYDTAGRLYYEGVCLKNLPKRIDTTSWSSGVYFVTGQSRSQPPFTRAFVKK